MELKAPPLAGLFLLALVPVWVSFPKMLTQSVRLTWTLRTRPNRCHLLRLPSVIQPLGSIGQLLLRVTAVPGRRLDVFVAEQLGQAHDVVAVVRKELRRHRVPEEMRMQVDADQGAVLVAKRPDAPFAERSTLIKKNFIIRYRGSASR